MTCGYLIYLRKRYFLILPIIAVMCISCSTQFQAWEGRNAIKEGQGGVRKIVDGMDIWTFGEPPRRFQVLGIIQDERPGGVLPMAQMNSDIVKKARQNGGDAVIVASSESQITGFYTHANVTAYGSGGSAYAYGNSTTTPVRHHSAMFVVVKYLSDEDDAKSAH